MQQKVTTINPRERRRYRRCGAARCEDIVCGDDVGIVLRSPHELATMMAVVLGAYQKVGLTVSGSKTESMPLLSVPGSVETALHMNWARRRF